MKAFFKNLRVSFLSAAVLYLVLGLILLLWPGITAKVFCYAFGAVLLLYGAISIISFFVHDSRSGLLQIELILGILFAGVGLIFLLKPDFVMKIFPVVLGIYLIIDALLNLKRAFELKRMGYQNWVVMLVLSLLSVAIGVVVLINPFQTAELLIRVIGGGFIYTGLSDLWTLFKLGRVTKTYRAVHPIDIDPTNIE